MPYEKINYAKATRVAVVSKDPDGKIEESWHDAVAPEVYVNWTKGSFMQVGVEYDTAHVEKILAIDREALGGEQPRVMLYTDTLSRDEVNKLIRVLRRVRDQAYGRDE